MSKSTSFAVVAVFLLAGVALLWKFPGQKSTPRAPIEQASVVSPQSPEPEEEFELPPPPIPVAPPPLPRTTAPAPPPAIPAPMTAANLPITPQERIDEILLSDELSEADKSRQLLQMLPGLPEAVQEEAAQHMCNLMPDETYGQLGPLLTNGVTPEPILDVVMNDLLGRPNLLKLPILLEMARNDQHPRRDESRSVLEIYLEQDFGSDWPAWERSLQAYLKENPE